MYLESQFHTNLSAVDSELQLHVKESLVVRTMKWSSQDVSFGKDPVIVALLYMLTVEVRMPASPPYTWSTSSTHVIVEGATQSSVRGQSAPAVTHSAVQHA